MVLDDVDSGVNGSVLLCVPATVADDVDRDVFETIRLPTVEEVVEAMNLDDSVDIHDDVDEGGVIVFDTATTGLDATKCPNVVHVFADLLCLVAVARLLDPHLSWRSLDVKVVELADEAAVSWVVDAAAGCGAVVAIGFDSAVVAVSFVTFVIADDFDAVADGFNPVVAFGFDVVGGFNAIVIFGFDAGNVADGFNVIVTVGFDAVVVADLVPFGFVVVADGFDFVEVADGFGAVDVADTVVAFGFDAVDVTDGFDAAVLADTIYYLVVLVL